MKIGWKGLAAVLMLVVLACFFGGAAFVFGSKLSNEQAIKHVIAVGGSVDCDAQPTYIADVGNERIAWDGGSPPRVYRILCWTYYSEPKDACFVDLSRCQLTNADCKTISTVRNATILNLQNASIPSDGFAYLMAIPSLEVVDLRGIAISSDILQILKRNDGLRAVIVTTSLVDPKIIRDFALDMPNCEITSE